MNHSTSNVLQKKCQLAIDFYMSVCTRNQWQVGHIGVSYRKHQYWILCVIIAKSENHSAALLLLKRAIELLREFGGDASKVLVDGGKALAKAIRLENEDRSNSLLSAQDHIDDLSSQNHIEDDDENHADAYYPALSRFSSEAKVVLERCHTHLARNEIPEVVVTWVGRGITLSCPEEVFPLHQRS